MRRIKRSISKLVALSCAFWFCGAAPLRAQSAGASEDAIRAALVQRLTLFVDWPSWKMDDSHARFNVCLIGNDPIGPALDSAFRGKPVGQKAVTVLRISALDKARDCHILYIGSNARRQVERDASSLEQAAVLTISERPESESLGQIVGLPKDDSRVRIEVNLKIATTSKLVISSRLLRLATITETP